MKYPITIDGNAGTITSPTGSVSFGNDTIATTAAIKAGSFITNKITINDTLVVHVIVTALQILRQQT